jgi:ubiquinone/menaquinone biosynthesis C-methylase UbiE
LGFEGLLERRSAAEYADFVLPWIGREDRVIDVGCGPGSITVGLARVAGHVTGVDVDDAEFTDARAYTAKHGIGNLEFLEGSIYELNFPDASFDVCTLFSMMETLDDPLAGLAEVRRVVRPGGVGGRIIDRVRGADLARTR